MPWQLFVSDLSLECTEQGRLVHDRVVVLAARQQGKTAWLVVRILWELYVRGSRLSIHTAQDRALAREVFTKVADLAQSVPELAAELADVRLANGQEEVRLKSGARYKIVAPTEGAARGLSVDGIAIIDEAREQKDWGLWGAISKTTLATDNPQTIVTSNAGTAMSVVLNDLRDRGRAASADPGADPSLAYMEWSAPPEAELDDITGWAQAAPALGHGFMTLDKLESAFRTDPPEVFATEVLCRWVETMAGVFPAGAWEACGADSVELPPDAMVFMAVDISPSRDEAALVAASPLPDGRLAVSVVQHWADAHGVNEVAIAAAITEWCGAFVVPLVGYDPRFAWSLAARLESQGVICRDIGGVRFYRASQELYEAVGNRRLVHPRDPYLDSQVDAAARQDVADGSWRISRRNSSRSIVATVALAMAVHLATDPTGGAALA